MGDWEGVSDGGKGLNLNKTPFKRLGYTDKKFEIFTQLSRNQGRGFFFKVLDENQKIVLNMGILKKKISTPNFTKFLNP